MAIRNIVKEGDEVLKKKCREVTEFDGRLAVLQQGAGPVIVELKSGSRNDELCTKTLDLLRAFPGV